MTIMLIHDLTKDSKVIGTLRIYMEGSGNPEDEHKIIGISVGGTHIGNTEAPYADKCEVLSAIEVC